MDSCAGLAEARGCPIRIFTDQSLFAAPRNFSQRTTSFIASQCQGIHQMLLSRLMLSLSMSIPCLAISLIPKPLAQFRADVRGSDLGRSEGQTSILRKTYMCSICLSWCGQAAMAHLIPCLSAWPVAGSTSKSLHSRCQSAKRQLHAERRNGSYEVSTAKCRITQKLFGWWSQTGSNRRPQACKASALPTELWPRPTPTIKRPDNLQPNQSWWAWEDLNFRPHAYQARALTN